MSPLRPPTDDHPASMLRWVRTVELVMVPVGILLALYLRADDVSVWWLGLVVAGTSLLSLATLGPAIRRAEARGPNDPATRPERRRRALRLTAATFAVFIVAVVVFLLATEGAGVALPVGGILVVSAALGLWLAPRFMP